MNKSFIRKSSGVLREKKKGGEGSGLGGRLRKAPLHAGSGVVRCLSSYEAVRHDAYGLGHSGCLSGLNPCLIRSILMHCMTFLCVSFLTSILGMII